MELKVKDRVVIEGLLQTNIKKFNPNKIRLLFIPVPGTLIISIKEKMEPFTNPHMMKIVTFLMNLIAVRKFFITANLLTHTIFGQKL